MHPAGLEPQPYDPKSHTKVAGTVGKAPHLRKMAKKLLDPSPALMTLHKFLITRNLPRMDSNHDKAIQSLLLERLLKGLAAKGHVNRNCRKFRLTVFASNFG